MKLHVIYYILGFLGAFLLEIQQTLLALGFLIMTDTFTGICAAWKAGAKKYGNFWSGWQYITSRKAGRIIIKLIFYPLAIIVAKVGEDYFMADIPWVDVTAGILAVVEIKSIFENIGNILGFSLWSKVRKIIWSDKIEHDKHH